jgi:transketolase
MRTFGASAPLDALQQEFGSTVEYVVATVTTVLKRVKPK